MRQSEDRFAVDVGEEDVFQKVSSSVCRIPETDTEVQRRKSMEPKALSLMSSVGPSGGSGIASLGQ